MRVTTGTGWSALRTTPGTEPVATLVNVMWFGPLGTPHPRLIPNRVDNAWLPALAAGPYAMSLTPGPARTCTTTTTGCKWSCAVGRGRAATSTGRRRPGLRKKTADRTRAGVQSLRQQKLVPQGPEHEHTSLPVALCGPRAAAPPETLHMATPPTPAEISPDRRAGWDSDLGLRFGDRTRKHKAGALVAPDLGAQLLVPRCVTLALSRPGLLENLLPLPLEALG